jgi:hypothetical protein
MTTIRTPFYYFNRAMIAASNAVFNSILRTPPMPMDPGSETILFSLLQKRDVNAYLLSAKSFLRYCPPLNVVVQSDGSLDHHDCTVLRAHLPGIHIIDRPSTESLVRGSVSAALLRLIRDTNWFVELKLLGPLVRFPQKYIIHFDSDLLFLKRPEAVLDCVSGRSRRTFYCPGGNVLAEPFKKMGFDSSKVDLASFNSGFVGFFNSINPEALGPVAETIRERNPGLFSIWDMEQALFGVLLNQTEEPFNLKSVDPNYVGSGWSTFKVLAEEATMCHFVGATRFRNLMYPRLARRVVRELQQAIS